MLDLAKHIVQRKSGHFEPDKFDDRYEHALKDLLKRKRKGQPIEKPAREPAGNVVNLMDALKASLNADKAPHASARRRPAKRRTTAQRKHHHAHRRKAS